MPGVSITIEITRNSLPKLIAALPDLMDAVQGDLVTQVKANALDVVPVGYGPEHEHRLRNDATLLQSHKIWHTDLGSWELVNDALHAGLVYFGNPLSPPRPWFEWALDSAWNWYRRRLGQFLAELEAIGGR